MITLSNVEPEVPHFGGCPVCGTADYYLNVRSRHWFVCDEHRTKWCAGSNLFSSWRDETQELWEANAEKLDTYRTVKPIYAEDELEIGNEPIHQQHADDFDTDSPF